VFRAFRATLGRAHDSNATEADGLYSRHARG